MLSTAPATAQTQYEFNFKNTGTSTIGSSKQFTSLTGGITVTVTAYYSSSATLYGGPSTPPTFSTPQAAQVGWYDNGLGVTSSGESGSPQHTVDNTCSNSTNFGSNCNFDFLELAFSTPVQIRDGYLTPYDVNSLMSGMDNDAFVSFTYVAGNPVTTSITSGAPYADLQLHATEVSGVLSSPYKMDLNQGRNTGNIWLIGASHDGSDRDDGFKLTGLFVQLPVPEPATWAMMLVGVGVAGGSMRRTRRAGARKLADA